MDRVTSLIDIPVGTTVRYKLKAMVVRDETERNPFVRCADGAGGQTFLVLPTDPARNDNPEEPNYGFEDGYTILWATYGESDPDQYDVIIEADGEVKVGDTVTIVIDGIVISRSIEDFIPGFGREHDSITVLGGFHNGVRLEDDIWQGSIDQGGIELYVHDWVSERPDIYSEAGEDESEPGQ